jgi:Rod binding domain-containing protein
MTRMVDIPTTIQHPAIQPPGLPGLVAPQPGPASRGQPDNPVEHTRENTRENTRLRAEAERFEAAFLAEMLRHSGLGQMPESFNGGPGEAAFAGSLVQEYANRIAATGTLGIADRIYQTLVERSLK